MHHYKTFQKNLKTKNMKKNVYTIKYIVYNIGDNFIESNMESN